MEAITTGITNVMGIVSTMLTTITGEPLLATFLAVGFVGTALGVLRKLIRTSRG